MTCEETVRSILISDPTIVKTLGARVYPMILPQDCTYPAISYTRITSVPVWSLSGYSSLENPHLQIDVWAETLAQAKSLSASVLKALLLSTSIKTVMLGDRHLYESDVKIHRWSTDYSFWHNQSI